MKRNPSGPFVTSLVLLALGCSGSVGPRRGHNCGPISGMQLARWHGQFAGVPDSVVVESLARVMNTRNGFTKTDSVTAGLALCCPELVVWDTPRNDTVAVLGQPGIVMLPREENAYFSPLIEMADCNPPFWAVMARRR